MYSSVAASSCDTEECRLSEEDAEDTGSLLMQMIAISEEHHISSFANASIHADINASNHLKTLHGSLHADTNASGPWGIRLVQVQVGRPTTVLGSLGTDINASKHVENTSQTARNHISALDLSREPINETLRELDSLGDDSKAVKVPTESNKSSGAGSDIWHRDSKWEQVSEHHPFGIKSKLYNSNNHHKWKRVSFFSLDVVMVVCALVYPAIPLVALLFLTILVSCCLVQNDQAAGSDEDQLLPDDWMSGPLPLLQKEHLVTPSCIIYASWVLFCRAVPCLMVFGIPALTVALARPYPQEILIALSLLTAMFVFTNGIHMIIFAGTGVREMRLSQETEYSMTAHGTAGPEVLHWVIFPQYQEDIAVVSLAMKSVAQSSIAKSSIGIVLAMEEREKDARLKVEELMHEFGGQFRAVAATYHPPGLPNDPPGKASNVAWAFKELCRSVSSEEELSKVVLTIADADSEFSAGFFESLSSRFLESSVRDRYLRLWQSPVFHMKNYHRLPAPVLVGSVYTCVQELALSADPNAVRFPYSTYSLSMKLAAQVGGWDAEWIAEDYHMGLKCFLMTSGQSSVEALHLPIINYVPEEEGQWWATCLARWTQAKRHALGFSDLTYFFMMLPLVIAHTTSSAAVAWDAPCEVQTNGHLVRGKANSLNMIIRGLTLTVRLVNTHVLLGVLSSYGVLAVLLKVCMWFYFAPDRHVTFLFSELAMVPSCMVIVGVVATGASTIIFMSMYMQLRPRLEGEPCHNNVVVHWLKVLLCVCLFSPVYFTLLGVATWRAALIVLFQASYEYEVAPKPVLGASKKQQPLPAG